MSAPELYADVVLPLAGGVYSYRLGDAIIGCAKPGICVEVKLGPSKIYTGIIWRVYSERPNFSKVRTVESIIENSPRITPLQMRFWEWIAEYYMCGLGEVMRAALPSALKPHGFSHTEFNKIIYRPRVYEFIKLNPSVGNQQQLNEKFESLKRAKSQYGALIEIVSALDPNNIYSSEVSRLSLKNIGKPIINQLVKKEIISIVEREAQNSDGYTLPDILPTLTTVQDNAFISIKHNFSKLNTVLLHGVTGSGKTEIYIKLIDEQLRKNKNVLYLLPEIAMTSQLVDRIKFYFGDRVVTYHSSYAENKRVESYMRVNRSKGGVLIMGVRSSIFLPAGNIGLVIVDEEHDGSYKNNDFSPRYHARDSAVVLAKMAGAKILLGSATPSLESYANALAGKFGLVELKERYGGRPLPRIVVSDTLKAVSRGERKTHFNKLLLDEIENALDKDEQVMLFQNRRGFSPYVECSECGWTATCTQCNVTLTLHKGEGRLKCHYCGHSEVAPLSCPACSMKAVDPKGFGTEKIEEELQEIFPNAILQRLDRDTATSVSRYNSIITSFAAGKTDILVGTQMITKGFDFENVSLVGILNADNLLAYPDFRASERAFQLMTQVAGRAGRRQKEGLVVVQTSQPDNLIVRQVIEGDYLSMVRCQMAEREAFFYPPFCRMVVLTLKHKDKLLISKCADELSEVLRPIFGRRLLGPQPPPVDRIRGEFLLNFLLKIERNQSFTKAKKLLYDSVHGIKGQKPYRSITFIFNVDPQ